MAGAAAAAAGGIMQGAGSYLGAQAQAAGMEQSAKMQLEGTKYSVDEQKRQSLARQAAYNSSVSKGGDVASAGESGFMGSVNSANPEIGQAEEDLRTGNLKSMNDATGQMNANLAEQGVRGGQAATLLNRGTGEMGIEAQKAINGMKFQDADTRAAQLRAYMAAKAQSGTAASLNSGGF